MPPCRVIEYQSKDMDRFSIQCGVSTMPPDTVVACSGASSGLPAWSSTDLEAGAARRIGLGLGADQDGREQFADARGADVRRQGGAQLDVLD